LLGLECNTYTHGHDTSGMHLTIPPIEAIEEGKPNYNIVVLPWNRKDEISQADGSRACPGWQFVTPSPPADVIRFRWSVL